MAALEQFLDSDSAGAGEAAEMAFFGLTSVIGMLASQA
jgi:hypothetical protein